MSSIFSETKAYRSLKSSENSSFHQINKGGFTDNARAYQAFLLKQAEEKKRERREEREGALRQAKIAQQVSAEEEGRFFDEVRKALQKMEPGLNNHSVKKCFNLKEKLQEAW